MDFDALLQSPDGEEVAQVKETPSTEETPNGSAESEGGDVSTEETEVDVKDKPTEDDTVARPKRTKTVTIAEPVEDSTAAKPKRSRAKVTIAEPVEDSTAAKPKRSRAKKAEPKPKATTAVKSKKTKTKKKKAGSLSLKEIVVAAVGALDNSKGATFANIKTWVLDNHDTVRVDMIKYQVRLGLTKALENELVRPHKPLEGDKVSLNARWHLKGKRKSTANKTTTKKKPAASKKVTTKKKSPTSKKPSKRSTKISITKVKPNDGGKYSLQDKVLSAIGALGDTKGASYPAIKAWILDNVDSARVDMIKHQVRLGLNKALENELIYPKKPLEDGNVSLQARWYLKGEAAKVLKTKSKK